MADEFLPRYHPIAQRLLRDLDDAFRRECTPTSPDHDRPLPRDVEHVQQVAVGLRAMELAR